MNCQLLYVGQIDWAPLVLAPLALVAWLVIIRWWINSLIYPGPFRKRVRLQRFQLEARLKRRSRMRAAVARSDVRAKERDELDLPSDEHVLWPSFWMVEIYLATHTPDLKKGFARLGWTEDAPGLGSIDADKWLDDARTGHGLSWTRLGFFRPRGSAL